VKTNLLFFLIFISIWSCASKEHEEHQSGLIVIEKNPTKGTMITKQNLLHLAQVYDLQPFFYTKIIQINSSAIPHSHPILTLNTKYSDYPKKILSTFLHQEFYWWAAAHKAHMDAAAKSLKKLFPKAPIIRGENPQSTYNRLIVGHLEFKALSFYLGNKEARGIIYSLMKKDNVYPWVYKQVLDKDAVIKKVIQKNNLIPNTLLEAYKKPVTLRR
jgi:hypothetical protein